MPDVSIYVHICEHLICPYIMYYIVIHNVGILLLFQQCKAVSIRCKDFSSQTQDIYYIGIWFVKISYFRPPLDAKIDPARCKDRSCRVRYTRSPTVCCIVCDTLSVYYLNSTLLEQNVSRILA